MPETTAAGPRCEVRTLGRVPTRPGRRGGEVVSVSLRTEHLAVEVLSLGATLTGAVHDPDGAAVPLVAGLDRWSDHDNPAVNHFVGSTMGRWCRFVTDPDIEIDGRTHRLATNAAGFHAHGGPDGFSFQNWSVDVEHRAPGTASAVLRHASPDGHQGYPGRVEAEVEYRLGLEGLAVHYRATTSEPTLLGMANHVYWRLGAEPVDDHVVVLPAERRLDIREDRPTPESPVPVEWPHDLRSARPLGDRRIDAFYVADAPGRTWTIASERLGLAIELTSSERGAGVYTGDRDPVRRRGICCQFGPWPGAEHRADFPSPVVRPDEPYRSRWRMRVRDGSS